MAMSNEDLLKELSAKPIMEVVELVKMLEEEWGVSAAAPVAVAAGPAGGAGGSDRHVNALGQQVLVHERDGLGRQDLHAVEFSAVHQHRAELRIVEHRRPEPAAA